MGVNVGHFLRQAALQQRARPGLVDAGHPGEQPRELAYAEIDELARTISARIVARGLGPGDAVALIGENSAEFVAAWFAIVYAGCAVVPIPILSAAAELRARVEHAGCKLVLFDGAREALVREAIASLDPAPHCIDLAKASRGPRRASAEIADTAPGDAALLLYTSGTTGGAKAAAISHAALGLHTAVLAQHALRLHEDDCVLGVLPLTHSYGCRMVMLASLFAGARFVLLPRFDAARSLAVMRAHAVSWLPAVPTMYAAWAAEPAHAPLPALRWGLSAGSPLADETARRAERALGIEVRQGYGMTEATFCTMNAPPDARVLGSVGKPVWGIEVRIVAPDGSELPAGQDGEVVVRGHNVMSGYLRDPEATALAFRGGFLHSGDVGHLDQAGRLTIVDRIKDLIIRGGHNVYPSEVEDALCAHPDVLHVAVVGRPDAYYGEEIVAVVIKREGSALEAGELVRWARARIGRTKLPREIAFTAALPLGPSGKVLKRTLRQWLHEGRLAVVSPEPDQKPSR